MKTLAFMRERWYTCLMRNARRVYRYSGTKETVDVTTGEVEKSVLVKLKQQDVNFIKLFLPERGYRMFPREMTISSRELLDYLFTVCDRQNIAIAPVSDIQERMDLSTATIARAKAQLLELDYIRQKTPHVFMVNPSHACKAKGDDRAKLFEAYSLLRSKKKSRGEE